MLDKNSVTSLTFVLLKLWIIGKKRLRDHFRGL